MSVSHNIIKIGTHKSLNKEISIARNKGIDYGIKLEKQLILCRNASPVYTKIALDIMSNQQSAILVFAIHGSDELYICLKSPSIINEFYGVPDSLEKQKIMITLLSLKGSYPCFSNLDDEVLKSGSVGFQIPIDTKVHKCELGLTKPNELKDLKTRMRKSKKITLASFSALLLTFLLLSVFRTEKSEPVAPKPIVPVKAERKFLALERFYTKASNAPYFHLIGLYRQLNQAKTIQGWQIHKAHILRTKNGGFQEVIQLQSSFGELKVLEPFIYRSKYSIDVDKNVATLVRDLESHSLFTNYARFHVGSFQKWLTSALNFVFEDAEIKTTEVKGIESKEKNVVVKASKITIPNLYPDDLDALAAILKGEPFSLEEFQLERKPTDSLSDAFEFTVTLAIAGVTNANQ